MFTKGFTGTVYQGEAITCEVDGFTATATIHADDSSDAPWDREEGHGEVSNWTTRDKAPGELVLNTDRDSKRFYDFAGAVQIAKRDCWGLADEFSSMTKRQRATAAARADFDRLRAWCRDQWTYVGVTVTVSRHGVQLVAPYEVALWGIESDAAEHLTDTANELLSEALDLARANIKALCA